MTGGTMHDNVAANEGGALWNGGGSMTVSGTSITNNDANGADQSEGGGGLFNEGGTLNISNATITGNNATGSGGDILNNSGSLIVSDSTISNNSSVRAGGGIEADARELDNSASTTLNNVTMNGNTTGGSPGNGGALHVSGGGSFTNNVASNEGGGLCNFGSGAVMTIDGDTPNGAVLIDNNGTGAANGGGGLFNNGGIMNVNDATISNNTATDGSGSGGGILNFDGGVLTVESSLISANTANRAGGGIETRGSDPTGQVGVALNNVLLTDNIVNTSTGNGGGLHAGSDARVNVSNSIVSNNIAGLEGGGLWVNDGTLNVDNSRISGNLGNGNRTGAENANADGGGIVVNGVGTANITDNTLISENTASGTQGSGGGIFNKPSGTVNVSDSVIGGNTSNRAGGGIENNGGTVTLCLCHQRIVIFYKLLICNVIPEKSGIQ